MRAAWAKKKVGPTHNRPLDKDLRGSLYDPSAQPLDGHGPFRTVGKIGIDATAKPRHDSKDFERAWPRNWGKVKLENYLS